MNERGMNSIELFEKKKVSRQLATNCCRLNLASSDGKFYDLGSE